MMNLFNLKSLTLVIALLFAQRSMAQIGIGTTTPSASAQLDVTSTTKGVLIPRVALTSLTSASPVTSPTTSLLVYNTATAGTSPSNVTPGYYYWNGTAWVRLSDNSTNTGSYEWNYVKGNPTGGSLGGTFVGDASWVANGSTGTSYSGYVQLTPNSSSKNGKLYWQQAIDWTQPLHVSAQFWAGGSAGGGDGNWVFFGCNSSSVATSAINSAASGGLSVFFDEYGTETVMVYKNGTLIAEFAPLQTLDNSTYQTIDLFFGKNTDGTRFLDIKIDGNFIGTADIGSFTAGGNYFGVGAWTGSASNQHACRRLLIEGGNTFAR